MSNLLGVIIGVLVIIGGLYLLIAWFPLFLRGLMAIGPILLIFIGAGVLIYFISEIKSKLEMRKEETSASGEKKSEEK